MFSFYTLNYQKIQKYLLEILKLLNCWALKTKQSTIDNLMSESKYMSESTKCITHNCITDITYT